MTENKTFTFELVSPEARLMAEPAWQVVVPGEEGHMGVRAGHASIVATVKPGVVKVWAAEGATPQKIFISGGFADITATNLTVLAEEAVNVNDLNAAKLEKEIQDLNDEIKLSGDDAVKRAALLSRLSLATAKLAAVSH